MIRNLTRRIATIAAVAAFGFGVTAVAATPVQAAWSGCNPGYMCLFRHQNGMMSPGEAVWQWTGGYVAQQTYRALDLGGATNNSASSAWNRAGGGQGLMSVFDGHKTAWAGCQGKYNDIALGVQTNFSSYMNDQTSCIESW